MLTNRAAEAKARAKAERLREAIRALGPVMKASVTHRRYSCGKRGCRCGRGALHEDLVVTRKVNGKTQTIRVRKGREKDALQWVANWRRYKQLLDELTTVQMNILKLNKEERP